MSGRKDRKKNWKMPKVTDVRGRKISDTERSFMACNNCTHYIVGAFAADIESFLKAQE